YVQASIDGATWTTLASYDGTNLSWSRKELSLNDYAGQTIYIRFKYVTDSSVDYEGVYIDDISIE
ncbi:MAG: choice-of-anchor J domain-containing protein, partial [Candidatus Margulisiibacteriota bacterium]